MNLPEQYRFLESGRPMTMGEMYRFNHKECGDTRQRLYVQRTKTGWLAHCHNCAPELSGFCPDKEGLTPQQLIKVLNMPDVEDKKSYKVSKFPLDFTQKLPMKALGWIHKYGITAEEIDKYHIGYSPSSGRVILPVLDSRNDVLLWQERSLDTNPVVKYITYFARELAEYADNLLIHVDNDELVVVEDYLSTIKVGRQRSCLCLHGSYFNPLLYKKFREYKSLAIWLDEDKFSTAYREHIKLCKMGINASVIKSPLDPKEYSDNEILKYLYSLEEDENENPF